MLNLLDQKVALIWYETTFAIIDLNRHVKNNSQLSSVIIGIEKDGNMYIHAYATLEVLQEKKGEEKKPMYACLNKLVSFASK